jgi:hypothetical protein
MSITPNDGPRLKSILRETEREFRAYVAEIDATVEHWGSEEVDDKIGEISEAAAPVMTYDLLQLALDTMTLMFMEPEIDTTEPFRCLWQAVVERVEEHLVEIRDELRKDLQEV